MKLATAPLDKAAVVARIKSEGAVAVIRTDSVERALGAAGAAIAGGEIRARLFESCTRTAAEYSDHADERSGRLQRCRVVPRRRGGRGRSRQRFRPGTDSKRRVGRPNPARAAVHGGGSRRSVRFF